MTRSRMKLDIFFLGTIRQEMSGGQDNLYQTYIAFLVNNKFEAIEVIKS